MRSVLVVAVWFAGGVACSGTGKSPASEDRPVDGTERADSGTPIDDSDIPPDTGQGSAAVVLDGRVSWPDGAVPDDVLAVAATHTTWLADTVVFGSTLAGVEVDADGRFALELPDRPPANELIHPAPADAPDLVGAVYVLTVFVPTTTGSLHFAEGRTIRGMGFHRLLVWFDPETMGDTGWPGGWTLVDTGLEGAHNPPACLTGTTQPLMWRWPDGYPHVYALGAEELVLPLRGAEAPLLLAGEVSGTLAGTDRLAAIPQQVAQGESASLLPVLDVDLSTGSFSATLSEAPPLNHNLSGDAGWEVTLAYLLQYADDGDGMWTLSGDGDATIASSACSDGKPTYLRYTRDVTTWRGMRLLECQNGRVGWRLLTLDDSGGTYVALDDSASIALQVSSACHF